MANMFKSLFKFQDPTGRNWTERVYYPGVTDFTTARNRAADYINARVKMIATGPRLVKHTINDDSVFKSYTFGLIPNPFVGNDGITKWNDDMGSQTGVPLVDFPWTTLLIETYGANNLYHSHMFLGGVPDSVTIDPGFTAPAKLVAPVDVAWDTAYANFRKIILGGGPIAPGNYGFKTWSRDPAVAPRLLITGATWAAGIQTVLTQPFVWQAGTKVFIGKSRGTGVNINGTWTLLTGGNGTFTFALPLSPGFTWGKEGYATPRVPIIVPIVDMHRSRITSHKRGGGPLDARGKGKKKGAHQYPNLSPSA